MVVQGSARWPAGIALGCLVAILGCQRLESVKQSLLPEWPKRGPLLQPKADDPLPQPSAQQKLNMQLTMARSLEAKGKNKEAIAAYAEIARKDAKNVAARHRLAVLHDKQGDHRKAEEYYRQALKQKRKDPVILADYGYSLYLQSRWPEAEDMLRQSLALDPHDERARGNLALVFARTERHNEALRTFAHAGCSEADARANLGYVLLWEERWEEARDQFQAALAAEPSDANAREGLAIAAARSPAPSEYETVEAPTAVAVQKPRENPLRNDNATAAAEDEAEVAPCGFSS